MNSTAAASLVILVALLNLYGTPAAGQDQDIGWEVRPKVAAAVELWRRTRLETWVERQHGVDFSFQRWRSGALLSYRMKPIVNLRREDIDENKDNRLVFSAGYE